MRKIDLDFHKAAIRRNNRTGFLLLLLGATTGIWVVNLHNDARSQQQEIKRLISNRQVNSRSTAPDQTQGGISELQRAAVVIEQLSFPWSNLFRAVEENAANDMALLSIQPDIPSKTMTLVAEARDWGGMVGYIKRLEESRYFSEVHVISHEAQPSDLGRSVRFKLSCTWDSLTPASASSEAASQR